MRAVDALVADSGELYTRADRHRRARPCAARSCDRAAARQGAPTPVRRVSVFAAGAVGAPRCRSRSAGCACGPRSSPRATCVPSRRWACSPPGRRVAGFAAARVRGAAHRPSSTTSRTSCSASPAPWRRRRRCARALADRDLPRRRTARRRRGPARRQGAARDAGAGALRDRRRPRARHRRHAGLPGRARPRGRPRVAGRPGARRPARRRRRAPRLSQALTRLAGSPVELQVDRRPAPAQRRPRAGRRPAGRSTTHARPARRSSATWATQLRRRHAPVDRARTRTERRPTARRAREQADGRADDRRRRDHRGAAPARRRVHARRSAPSRSAGSSRSATASRACPGCPARGSTSCSSSRTARSASR